MGEAAAEMVNEIQITIRVPGDLPERAEALVAPMRADPAFYGFRVSRTAVLRRAMMEGLRGLEAQYGGKPAGGDK